ncbi:alpha/beta fold hydrolase [Adhaeretor mobilis]|uniref:AB hydrolase superfamily protein YdjP n=1 Tax=Adhaeretor mobilis TaxID=1930276 RepID=A0A517N1L1_9BACT|nr:alpha/beta hydrolase [Adhaeretor mobilis]QDT01024.1 AB hydrolase superfamily protein YdjP [Adhaeretor mobilis]
MNSTTSINGIQLTYETHGKGTPVVLLHGFPLDAQMWQPQVEALSAGYQVIVPNLRGYGGSTQTEQDGTEGVTMRQYADDIIALLDELSINEPVVLAGFSMGGYVAWQFALNYPERLKALIACDTRVIADPPEAREKRQKMASLMQSAKDTEAATSMLSVMLATSKQQHAPSVAEKVKEMILRQSPLAVAAAQLGMAARPDVTERLKEITCPALVVCGAEDAISPPAEMRGIANALPNASFLEIPNAGHMTTLENPQAVNEAFADFLKGL